jgi:hypothetical protein
MRRDAPPQAPDPVPDRAHAEKLSFVPLAEGLSALVDTWNYDYSMCDNCVDAMPDEEEGGED